MSHQAELLPLHFSLVAGDIRAAHKIVEIAIVPLKNIVAFRVGMNDPQDVEQACIDALLVYLQRPAIYVPGRAELLTYLAAVAVGKARTMRRTNVRRLEHDTRYAKLEDDTPPVDTGLNLDELSSEHRLELVKEPGDDTLLDLIAMGVNEPPRIAKALMLAADEQGNEEARKRLERMRGRLRRLMLKTGAE
jgi:DNA-directed RNA polymerase specialized sigma24 family protein